MSNSSARCISLRNWNSKICSFRLWLQENKFVTWQLNTLHQLSCRICVTQIGHESLTRCEKNKVIVEWAKLIRKVGSGGLVHILKFVGFVQIRHWSSFVGKVRLVLRGQCPYRRRAGCFTSYGLRIRDVRTLYEERVCVEMGNYAFDTDYLFE